MPSGWLALPRTSIGRGLRVGVWMAMARIVTALAGSMPWSPRNCAVAGGSGEPMGRYRLLATWVAGFLRAQERREGWPGGLGARHAGGGGARHAGVRRHPAPRVPSLRHRHIGSLLLCSSAVTT